MPNFDRLSSVLRDCAAILAGSSIVSLVSRPRFVPVNLDIFVNAADYNCLKHRMEEEGAISAKTITEIYSYVSHARSFYFVWMLLL